ncbi:hypothetical protein [Streptomyces sp. NPDC002276]
MAGVGGEDLSQVRESAGLGRREEGLHEAPTRDGVHRLPAVFRSETLLGP